MRLPRTPFRWIQNILLFLAWIWLFMQWGCASSGLGVPVAPRSGQEQAVWLIWSSYGRTDTPPLVRWVEGKALSCTDPDSNKRGFPQPAYGGHLDEPVVMVCHEGFTWSPLEVVVSWHGEDSFADTALAHEMEHAELLRRGFILEIHHDRPDFFSRIDAANEAVRKAGR